jgi:nicotinamide-nucleotide amidase
MSLNSEKLSRLIRSLRDQKLTVSFAESCTGGALSAFLTEQAGVSDIFLGSVVSYSNEAKVDLLGVRREALMNEGAVSEIVARQMAQGVRKQLKTDWSVAVTGIAGPSGGTATKPVGTVCFAIAGPDFEESRKEIFSGDRKAIQQQSVNCAIGWLAEVLDRN